MTKFRMPKRLMGLITLTSLISLSTGYLATYANAERFEGVIATYSSPREYNPSPKYYVPGQLDSYSQGRINVRTGPGTHYYAKHYGLKGDRVTILNDSWGNDGYKWWYLKFNQSGARGWVRSDLVLLNH